MPHDLNAYAYTNRLKQLPPQQKLTFALVILSIALVTHPIAQGLIFVWLSVWIVGYARIPAKIYGRVLFVIMFFLFASLPALIIEGVSAAQLDRIQTNSLAGVVLGDWYFFISQTGLMRAVEVSMRSLACVSCLLFILFTIPFAELLAIMRRCRVPSLLIDLLLLMYRFIFLFLEVALQLELAQRSRGGYRTRQRWLHSTGLLIGQLVVRSLQRYQQFSLGLAARGFNGNFKVYTHQSYHYSQRYAIESLVGCIGLILLESQFVIRNS
ncbi:cobalt ECF transporter T component CbiQ [Oscillatoria sp. FACHB-1406]|uniref:cobalt ECF transporter T component CbiQ n=1 Tax=Oscillatoria sp. FACHB-1406 TaxID=2692846 RepID=UPI0016839345|nr:cobalt ECF transporter T component CbiQ [Oscillatoria sp. FACHB-1406]MBD2579873.1 cobalt ECF transporter T component CbiQ [Oscillatoria sp. FACHB-1406]